MSRTVDLTATLGIEIGPEEAKFKQEFSLSTSQTVSHGGAHTDTRNYSVTGNYDVAPGHKQWLQLEVEKVRTTIPYQGYWVYEIQGRKYLSRNFVHATFESVDGKSARVYYGKPEKCASN